MRSWAAGSVFFALGIVGALPGCGGGGYYEASYGMSPGGTTVATSSGDSYGLDARSEMAEASPSEYYGGGGGGSGSMGGEPPPAPPPPPQAEQPRYAQAQPPEDQERTATDAVSGPLLIYTAQLTLSVHQVTEKQDQVIAIATDLGGHLARRTDDLVEIRVPSRAFDAAMRAIQELGNVLSRNVEVRDVTEEFRDLETRIHTLEIMRARVEQLLAAANGVEAALAVEQHLERITVELEQLRGRVRFLADRVAYSTISIRFGELTQSQEPTFRLPFSWLQQLGLDTLLSF